MNSYRDNETTTIVATPLEISRLLTDMLRMEFLIQNCHPCPDTTVQTHCTHTKTKGKSYVVFKLDRAYMKAEPIFRKAEIKPKPCPFCGKPPTFVPHDETRKTLGCSTCNVWPASARQTSEQDAIDNWNKRV